MGTPKSNSISKDSNSRTNPSMNTMVGTGIAICAAVLRTIRPNCSRLTLSSPATTIAVIGRTPYAMNSASRTNGPMIRKPSLSASTI